MGVGASSPPAGHGARRSVNPPLARVVGAAESGGRVLFAVVGIKSASARLTTTGVRSRWRKRDVWPALGAAKLEEEKEMTEPPKRRVLKIHRG